MTHLGRVPVVDVHNDNLREVWPSLILAMSSSSFIAVDTELSGLGQRKKLNAKLVEDRYKNISETARTRSILSLGISCFKQTPPITGSQPEGGGDADQSGTSYIVQTFNLLLLCEEDYMVEPASLRFLVQHGFDFNKQYEKGISYYRGTDKATDQSIQSVRHLFTELVSMKVPVILHNGLVDLMFLYENLYTSLPETSAMFLGDLVDLFPSGIVDTKYITDYDHMMQASYLEYVFRKCQKDNGKLPAACSVHFPHYPSSYGQVTYRDCSLRPEYEIGQNPDAYKRVLCETYSGHGWCLKGKFCPKSHDIDLIIDVDDYMADRKSRKRRRRKQNKEQRSCENTQENTSNSAIDTKSDRNEVLDQSHVSNADNCDTAEDSAGEDKQVTAEEIIAAILADKNDADDTHANGGHKAGYDAFMTGFIYAVFLQKARADGKEAADWKNKLYLGGKDYPLSVSKSSFTKQSRQHLEKIARIRKTTV